MVLLVLTCLQSWNTTTHSKAGQFDSHRYSSWTAFIWTSIIPASTALQTPIELSRVHCRNAKLCKSPHLARTTRAPFTYHLARCQRPSSESARARKTALISCPGCKISLPLQSCLHPIETSLRRILPGISLCSQYANRGQMAAHVTNYWKWIIAL